MNCQRNLNSVRNSDKLKNSAAPSSGDFFSLSTGAAENFIFLVLRVLLQFLISRDVIMLYMGPTLAFSVLYRDKSALRKKKAKKVER
jgi:hypothetical protein